MVLSSGFTVTVLDLEAHLKASGTVLPVVSYHSSTRERDSDKIVSIYMHALILQKYSLLDVISMSFGAALQKIGVY